MALCLKANEELARQGKKPIFTPEEKIATSNGWFPGRSKPLNDGMRVHKYLNMNLAIQKSSNIYPARLVQRLIETMGDQWYRKALEETFGFGQKTMIELPAESPGLVPTPGKLHPNGKLEWSVPTPYSLALGYNILLNGIQIVRAYAVLANGGRLIQPHIVRKIARKTEGGGETVLLDRTNPKALASKQVLSSSITQTVIKAMKFTTKEGGTARRGDVPGYTEVGKSGTAEKVLAGQYAKQHNLSSFLGFVPAQNPRFVLLVSIDDPEIKIIPGVGKHQLGGVCASPVFREISLKALRYLGVDPDDPYGYPPGDPRRDADKADWAFEVNVLKKLYQQWNEQ
jgi:cell division protein FtsI (penicillin-binding protein 3)